MSDFAVHPHSPSNDAQPRLANIISDHYEPIASGETNQQAIAFFTITQRFFRFFPLRNILRQKPSVFHRRIHLETRV